MIRRILHFLCFGMLALAASDGAGARADDGVRIGGWKIVEDRADQGFPYCVMSTDTEEAGFYFFNAREDGWSFMLSRDAWNLKAPRRITVTVTLDDDTPLKVKADVADGQSLGFFFSSAGLKPERFRTASTLRLKVFSKEYALALRDMPKAMDAVETCVAQAEAKGGTSTARSALAPKEKAVQQSAPKDAIGDAGEDWETAGFGGTLPSDPAAEAEIIADNILRLAGIDHYRFQPRLKRSRDQSGSSVTWSARDHVGIATTIADLPIERVPEVEGAQLALFQQQCEGRFETASTGSNGTVLIRRLSVCRAAEQMYLAMYIIRRSRGGVYQLGVKAEAEETINELNGKILAVLEPR